MPGRTVLAACAVVATIGIAGAVAYERSRGASAADRPPALQVSGLSRTPSGSTVPTAADRKRFVDAWSVGGLHGGPPVIRTLNLQHFTRFTLGPNRLSVLAAPSTTGGICWIGSEGGGSCIASFHRGAGMTEGYRKVDGTKHNVITGLVPDGFTQITFTTQFGHYSTPVRDNLFRFVIPLRDSSPIRSYRLTGDGGASRVEPWPVLPSG